MDAGASPPDHGDEDDSQSSDVAIAPGRRRGDVQAVLQCEAMAVAWNNAASLLRTISNATVLTYICAVREERKPGQRAMQTKVLNAAQALALRYLQHHITEACELVDGVTERLEEAMPFGGLADASGRGPPMSVARVMGFARRLAAEEGRITSKYARQFATFRVLKSPLPPSAGADADAASGDNGEAAVA